MMIKNSERRKFIKAGAGTAAGLFITSSFANGAFLSNSFLKQIGEGTFNIKDYGAVGDVKTLNTESIQNAIDACAAAGGGRVVIPKGTFLTGGLTLTSNMDFHLEEDAVLLGSPHMKDYEPRVLKNEARFQRYLKYAVLFALGEKNITVSGKGKLNGNGQKGGELGEFEEKGSAADKRPCLLWFDECENILVKDITYTNSGMWTETYSRCKNVHVNGITVTENYFFNADGCNMLDCTDFIIENCDINTMDDGICLKGYTKQGCVRGIIRNNRVRSICNGIKMGTDSSGGFRDILIENNEIWQTNIAGIALEMVDGGIMDSITIQNITMDVVATPVFIILSNRNRPIYGELTVPKSVIRNIYIRNIKATVNKAEKYNEKERKHFDFIPYASSITGFPENYIENINMEDISITIQGGFPVRTSDDPLREIPEAGIKYPTSRMFGVLPSYGFYIRHVRDIRMKNINLIAEQEDGRPAILIDDVHNSQFDDIKIKSVKRTPAFSAKSDCSGIHVDLKL